MKKMHQLADSVHVTIPVTEFEKDVISTVLFNRLHNILQNSTQYLTFPSCRTSRFSHSLGTMHLAGELFREAILNAEALHRKDFFASIINELNGIVISNEFVKKSRTSYELAPALPEIPEDAVNHRNIPSFLDENERTIFSILFQAIRFYGLLHDLGHPPFSHVAEKALTTIYLNITDKPKHTKRETEFIEILEQYRGGRTQKELHEIASKDLVSEVFHKVIDPDDKKVAQFRYFIQIVVLEIIQLQSNVLGSLHKLVDGDLDADRLDFTSRDLVSTGLGKKLGYERIINTFTLYEDQEKRFHFLPSIRSLYSIETFFASRFDLYRFAVFHHRVRKFDGLFIEALKGVALDYLQKKEDRLLPKNNHLPQDISGLWHVLSPKCKSQNPDTVAAYYSQWDDAWLLNILREHYYLGDPDHILKTQLEEILSNKKHYWPLFKRPECFGAIDAAFIKSGRSLFKSAAFWKSKAFKELSKEKINGLRALSNGGRLECSRTLSIGFFITFIIQTADDCQAHFVQSAIARLGKDTSLNIIHAFCVERLLKSGITDLEILTETGPQDINKVSNIQHALDTDAKLFPPLFVFFLPQPKTSINIEFIQERFGKYLFLEYKKLLNQKKRPKYVQRNRKKRTVTPQNRL